MALLPPDFDYDRVKWWAQEAQRHWDNEEPVISFICAWIAFNYCYALSWTNLLKQRKRPGKNLRFPRLFGFDYWQDTEGYVPDHVQIATFINKGQDNHEFGSFWDSFLARHRNSLVQEIGLPVLHLETNTPVPRAKPPEKRLIDLDITSLFQVLVTIRNNLFHGGKRFASSRSLKVCSCAAEFMVPFVTELIDAAVLSEEDED